MAIGETLVTVIGNVASDLSRRAVGGGDEMVSFWLRSNERRFDRDTERWCDGRSLAVRVTCWRRLAGTVGASLAKGDPVIVNGRLHTSHYEVDGQRRSVPELEALAIGPNLSWCTVSVRRLGRASGEERAAYEGGSPGPSLDEEAVRGEREGAAVG